MPKLQSLVIPFPIRARVKFALQRLHAALEYTFAPMYSYIVLSVRSVVPFFNPMLDTYIGPLGRGGLGRVSSLDPETVIARGVN